MCHIFSHIAFYCILFIDFWTTKCVKCPDALDNLDSLAQDPKYSNVEFTSIVLDACDGARSIIEENGHDRWSNVRHYFMDKSFKEEAKSLLGFQQVPFYVVLDEKGDIVQKGGSKQVDFDEIPGIVRHTEKEPVVRDEIVEDRCISRTDGQSYTVERIFCMDDEF